MHGNINAQHYIILLVVNCQDSSEMEGRKEQIAFLQMERGNFEEITID